MNRISLYNLNTDNTITFPEKTDTVFTLTGEIGRGASCIVYHAVCADNTEHLLKEYYPKHLDLTRDHTGNITSSESDTCAYEEGMERFRSGCEQQKNIRLYEDGLKNYTSNIQDCYKANGTEYIDMTCFSGCTYDHVHEKSVYDLLRRMKTLTQVIGKYHDAGLLHLDIKPENIYVRPEEETVEDVMLFDFDSVVSMQEATTGDKPLSCTKTWAAPEQLLPRKRKMISPATDLFAIGEIVFYQLFGRHSEASERRSYVCTYPYDRNAEIFKNMNPKVFTLLDAFFCHTIHSDISERYQTAADMMESLDKMISLADPKEPYLVSSLPVPKDFFIGRNTEIEDIHRMLSENNILFLHGIGGIGKTELAKQYAVKYKDKYDTVIFAPYITDMISMITDDSYVKIGNFSPDSKTLEDRYAEKLNKIHELTESNGDRILMIIDNLDSTDDNNIKKTIDALGCRILITTRVNFKNYNLGQQKDINEFSDPTIARQVFDYNYSGILSEEESQNVDKIIDLIHGHTMAVELIAKQIDAEWSTPKEIREKLENGGLASIGDEDVDTEKDGKFTSASAFGHIKALFDLSIFEKEGKENELYVLANLSLIPYTGIDRKLFAKWCELDQHGGKTCVNNLIKSGWVKLASETKLSLHPVVADVMREELKQSFSVCDRLIKSITKYIKDNSSTLLKDQEFIFQVNYICKIICSFDVFSIFSVGLIRNVIDAFYKASNPHEYALYLKKAISVFEQMSCKTDKALASMYNILGVLYQRAESFNEAEQSYIHALSIADISNDDLSILKASLYNNLGSLYHDMDLLDKAKEMYEKALSIRLELYGEQHEETAISYTSLGVLSTTRGDLSKAKEYFEKALQIWLKALGPQHTNVATCYSNIGSIYHEQYKFDQAEEYFLRALSIRIKQYGENNADVAASYNSLGVLYKHWGQFNKAEDYYLKALQIRQKIFGENHSSTASIYMNLSSLYRNYGNMKKAEEFGKKALDIFIKVLGEDHNSTATGYSHLGTFYLQLGNYDLAEKLYKKAFDIRMELYGNKHSDTVRSQNDLGAVYLKSGKYAKAAEYLSDAVEKMHSIYGEQHGEIASTYLNLASAYLFMKKYDQAEVYYKKSLNINQMIFGEKHNETATSYNNLGTLYETWGNIEKAEVFYVKANKIWAELYGENSLKVVASYQHLGVIYRKQGKYQDAIIYLQKAYDISLREYGKLHDNVASAYSALGYTYMLCNEFEKAHYNLTEALQIRRQLYGEEHEKVKLVRDRIQELNSLMTQSQD